MSENFVRVENLTKDFGKRRVLKGISFNVRKGEIFGLIGPNGAGKTTTLRIIATLLKPTDGDVIIGSMSVIKDARMVREIISYLPEEAGVYERLTGIEFLKFFAEISGSNTNEAIKRGIEISGLGERLKDKTKEYSKGMRRRLLLARTLMNLPKLALLDEPTSGLDVQHAVQIRQTIKNYREKYETTIILSSHNMLEVEYLCDRVAFINDGLIINIGTPKELKENYNAENLEDAFLKAVSNFAK
ncbi:MAG: ABC transporter ATP-binding protein [Thermoprotei archaeon]|jgi:ABC-2 type transport system ATP-binding protein